MHKRDVKELKKPQHCTMKPCRGRAKIMIKSIIFLVSAGQVVLRTANIFEELLNMNLTFRSKLVVSVLLGLMSMSSVLMAQQYELDIDKPEFEAMLSPTIDGRTTAKKFDPKEWLEVELKIKIAASNRGELFADRVTVKWYVAANVTENGDTKVRLLEKEINYVNVPIDEDIYVSVYLSPSAVKRISGKDKAAENTIREIGGEILVNGVQPVKNKSGISSGFFSTMPKSKGRWWDKLTPYKKIPLLNKNETPFKFFWWDRYAEIEELD